MHGLPDKAVISATLTPIMSSPSRQSLTSGTVVAILEHGDLKGAYGTIVYASPYRILVTVKVGSAWYDLHPDKLALA